MAIFNSYVCLPETETILISISVQKTLTAKRDPGDPCGRFRARSGKRSTWELGMITTNEIGIKITKNQTKNVGIWTKWEDIKTKQR